MRYIGTGTTFTDNSGLSAGTTYYYRVYTADKAFNYSTVSDGSGTTSTAATPTIYHQGSLSNFSGVVVGSSSPGQSYTVYGVNLTEDIVVTAPTHFELSFDDFNYYSSRTLTLQGDSVPHTQLYARFSPASTGTKSGDVIHVSAGAETLKLAVSGSGLRAEPGTQASSVGFSAVGADTFTVGWARGTGDSCIVLIRNGGAVNSDPVDGADYAADAAYGAGSQIGTGNYVVYKGTGASVKVTALSPSNTYHLAIYEYNSDGPASANYRTASPAAGSQATLSAPYVWNQTGTADWTVAANWTPARTTPSAVDILQFSNGAATTATSVPAQTVGQLSVTGGTSVTLQAGGTNTLAIAGDAGTDLVVESGSKLAVGGANALTISLATGATGSIADSVIFAGGGHRLLAADAAGITFGSGGVFLAGTGFTGNAFGTTSLGSVIFADGAHYVFRAGSNPFGAGQPNSVVAFQTGSRYRHESTSVPALSGRTYADFELNWAAANISGTGSAALTIDDLSVSQGALNLGMTGAFNLRGSVDVATGATLNFNPASAAALTFNGPGPQAVAGSGTLTLQPNQSVVLDNSGGLSLQRDLTVRGGLSLTNGELAIGANTLTLKGALTLGSGSLAGGATSNLTLDSAGTTALPGVELNDLTLGRGSADSVVVDGGILTVNGTLTLGGGTLAMVNGSTLEIHNAIAGTPADFQPDSTLSLYVLGSGSGITIPAACDSVQGLVLNNPNGVALAGDLTLYNYGMFYLYDGTVTGNGHGIRYGIAGLCYCGTSAQATSDAEWPASDGPPYVVIDNPAGVTLHADRTIPGLGYGLDLSQGAFSTGGNTITVETPDASVNPGAGHVDGNLRLYAPAGGGVILGFDNGANGVYSPLVLTFDNVTTAGYLTCAARHDDGGYPNASDALAASKRYWTLRRGVSGSDTMDFDTCTVELHYDDADFNTNFTLAAEDTMRCGCRYDDGQAKRTWWDFFPVTRDQENNTVTLSSVSSDKFGRTAAGTDFLFGAGYWVLAATSWSGAESDARPAAGLPRAFALSRPYPNPASGRAALALSLPDARRVRLDIYNMLGQRVACAVDRTLPAGRHQLDWDLRDDGRNRVGGGVYFYRLAAGDNTVTGRLTVLR